MKTYSFSDFEIIDKKHPNFLFLRIDERTCSTRYLIKEKGKLLLIDSGDGKDALDFIPDICLLTHGHYDHTCGVKPEWKEVFLHKNENPSLPYINIPKNAKKFGDGKFKFGNLEFEITNTPGHTPGSICIFEPNSKLFFSGDTKFANGGCGRTDLGGSDEEMEKSLAAISKIPYLLLCPGHGEIECKNGKII